MGSVFLAVTRTDLRQLAKSRDYWLPMGLLASLFFVVVPIVALNIVAGAQDSDVVTQIGTVLETLPLTIQENIQGDSPEVRAAFAIAVYLLAPIAVVVPLTIAAAVGSNTIVGERERGTGEFLAHSPASAREIYLGKLVASLVPGYSTVVAGFGAYSIIVNLTVGPSVGGWFFPTAQWWVMIAWVLPPFLAICLSLVLRLSARVSSTAAAQQASGLVSLPLIMIAYSQATGVLFGAGYVPFVVGGLAWLLAVFSLRRGMRSVSRSRLLGV